MQRNYWHVSIELWVSPTGQPIKSSRFDPNLEVKSCKVSMNHDNYWLMVRFQNVSISFQIPSMNYHPIWPNFDFCLCSGIAILKNQLTYLLQATTGLMHQTLNSTYVHFCPGTCDSFLDQISDGMCNSLVIHSQTAVIRVLPLIRIVWIKETSVLKVWRKFHAHLMKLFHKMYNFQISKISFVHVSQHCWVGLWQPIVKIVTWMWQKLLDKTLLWAFKPYKSYILTSWLCQASCTHVEMMGHMPMFTQKCKQHIPLFQFGPNFRHV